MDEMNLSSWREIVDEVMIIRGMTHPSYFSKDRLVEFFGLIAEVTEMVTFGLPIIQECSDVPMVNGQTCHGLVGFQIWKTSGCSIYTWDIGKLTVLIHTCKPFNHKKALEATKTFFHLQPDYEYLVVNSNEWITDLKELQLAKEMLEND